MDVLWIVGGAIPTFGQYLSSQPFFQVPRPVLGTHVPEILHPLVSGLSLQLVAQLVGDEFVAIGDDAVVIRVRSPLTFRFR